MKPSTYKEDLVRVVAALLFALGFAPTGLASMTLENQELSLLVNDSGGFTLWRASDRAYLLYRNPATTAFSLKVDEVVYSAQEVPPSVSGPVQQSAVEGYLEYLTPQMIRLRHTFALRGKAVEFHVTARNEDLGAHEVGVRYLFDTQIAYNDGSPLYAPGVNQSQIVVQELEIAPVRFREWRSYDCFPSPNLSGYGTIATIPSMVTFANWHNVEVTSWAYSADPTWSITDDSAVLMFFEFGRLVPGQEAESVTYYGLGPPDTSGAEGSYFLLASKVRDLAATANEAIDLHRQRFASAYARAAVTLREDSTLGFPGTCVDVFNLVADFVAGGGASDSLTSKFAQEFVSFADKYSVVAGVTSLSMDQLIKAPGPEAIRGFAEWQRVHEDDLGSPSTEQTIAELVGIALRTGVVQFAGADGEPLPKAGYDAIKDKVTAAAESYLAGFSKTLRADFPAEHVLRYLDLQQQALRASMSRECVIPPTRSPSGDLIVLGSEGTCLDPLLQELNQHQQGGGVKWALRGFQVAGIVGKAFVIVNTAGVSGAAELALAGGQAFLAALGALNTVCTMTADQSASLHLLSCYTAANRESSLDANLVKATLDFLATSQSASSNTLTVANDMVSVVQDSFTVPDMEIASGDHADAQATIRVKNSGSDRVPVCAYVEVYPKNRDQVPMTIAVSDTAEVGPGETTTLTIPLRGLPMSELVGSMDYVAGATVGVGPVLKHIGLLGGERLFTIKRPLAPRKPVTVTSMPGFVCLADKWTETRPSSPGAAVTTYMLQYDGGDLDLHLHSSAGGHVGVDYASGQIEMTIPGAEYSGPGVPREWIRVTNSADPEFTVEVVGVLTDGPREEFSLAAIEEGAIGPVLALDQDNVTLSMDPARETSARFSVVVREIGGQQSYSGLVPAVSALTGPGGAIPKENVIMGVSSAIIPAGGHTVVTTTVVLPANAQTGLYTGTMSFGAALAAIPIELRAEWNRCASPLLRLELVPLPAGTYPKLTVNGKLGASCRIDALTGFVCGAHWETVRTYQMTNAVLEWLDPLPVGASPRFYRAVVTP